MSMRQTETDGWGRTADRIGPVPPIPLAVQTMTLTLLQHEDDRETLAFALGLLCPTGADDD